MVRVLGPRPPSLLPTAQPTLVSPQRIRRRRRRREGRLARARSGPRGGERGTRLARVLGPPHPRLLSTVRSILILAASKPLILAGVVGGIMLRPELLTTVRGDVVVLRTAGEVAKSAALRRGGGKTPHRLAAAGGGGVAAVREQPSQEPESFALTMLCCAKGSPP